MNLVIVAGGLNTRFKILQKFPKLLLPTEDSGSVLSHYMKFSDHFDKVTVIVNEKYYDMVCEYVKNNQLNATIIKSSNTNGSYNTIKSVESQLPKSPSLFVWSDLVLQDLSWVSKLGNDNAIFTTSGRYRFKYDGSSLSPVSENGNVPGVYFLNEINLDIPLDTYSNYDLVEWLAEKKPTQIALPTELLEFRDLETYENVYKTYPVVENRTRFFNSIEIDKKNNTCTKKCICSDFNHLIDRELKWYNAVKEICNNIPKIISTDEDNHQFTMEYLDAKPMWKYIKENRNDVSKIDSFINRYVSDLNALHKFGVSGLNEDILKSAKIEFYTKVLDRCNRISHMIDGYDGNELNDLLTRAYEVILKGFGTSKYQYIPVGHGDLNGSNVLVDKDGKAWMIDPRGYFGELELHFPEIYDWSKILYAFYGYDEFNIGRYMYYDKDNYDTPEKLYDLDRLPQIINNKTNRIIVGIIFVALAQYISQDIFKVNIAYHYGIKILKEELDGITIS